MGIEYIFYFKLQKIKFKRFKYGEHERHVMGSWQGDNLTRTKFLGKYYVKHLL